MGALTPLSMPGSISFVESKTTLTVPANGFSITERLLPPGTYDLTILAEDHCGNISEDSIPVTIQ